MIPFDILCEIIEFLDFKSTLVFLSVDKSMSDYIKQKKTRSFNLLLNRLNTKSFSIQTKLLRPKKFSSLLVFFDTDEFKRCNYIYLEENFDTIKCCLLYLNRNNHSCDIIDFLEKTFTTLKTDFWIVESLKSSCCVNLSLILLSVYFNKDFNLEKIHSEHAGVIVEQFISKKYLTEFQQFAENTDSIQDLLNCIDDYPQGIELIFYPPLYILRCNHFLTQIKEFEEIDCFKTKLEITLLFLKHRIISISQETINQTLEIWQKYNINITPRLLLISTLVSDLNKRLSIIVRHQPELDWTDLNKTLINILMFCSMKDLVFVCRYILKTDILKNLFCIDDDSESPIFPAQNLIKMLTIYRTRISFSLFKKLFEIFSPNFLLVNPYYLFYALLNTNVIENLNLMKDHQDLMRKSEFFMLLKPSILSQTIRSPLCESIWENLHLIVLIRDKVIDQLSLDELADKSKLLSLL